MGFFTLSQRLHAAIQVRRQGVVPRAVPEINASTTRSKLMRHKKAELQEATKQRSLSTDGTKNELADRLVDSMGEFQECFPGKVTVHAQKSVLLSRPIPKKKLQIDLPVMESRSLAVEALDAEIKKKLLRMEEVTNDDRAAVANLVAEMSQLKEVWENELKGLSDELTAAGQLIATRDEVSTLKTQYAEILTTIKKYESRNKELAHQNEQLAQQNKQLSARLEAKPVELIADVESCCIEALAVLALASPATGNYPAATGNFVASGPMTWTLPDLADSTTPITTPRYPPSPPRELTNEEQQIASNKRMLGMALPGLVIINAVRTISGGYTAVRDFVLRDSGKRVLADTATAVLIAGVTTQAITSGM